MSLWHSRGYLPHWEAGETAQSITFRTADSLPASLLASWQVELDSLADSKAALERRRRIERAIDQGHGELLLKDDRIADIVERALLHFDGQRYRLHAWVVMPNHVHVIATPLGDYTLSSIAHSWKSFTGTAVHRLLGRKGSFWAPEYFDRAIRDDEHYLNAVAYVAMNPVKARLCAAAEDWRYSSAWCGRK